MKILENKENCLKVAFPIQGNEKGELFEYDLSGEASELAPLFSGPVWSAIVWTEAVQAMCDFLERNVDEVKNKTVVELGCGLGIPGLCAGISCHAKKVYLTDLKEDLTFVSKALKRNQTKFFGEVVPFNWADDCEHLLFNAEVVIAVECVSADVYGVESLDWLISAIKNVSSKSAPVTVFLCSARRKNDGLDFILEELTKLSEVSPKLSAQNGKIELYKAIVRL